MHDKAVKFQSRVTANWEKIPIVEGAVKAMDTEKIDKRVSRFIVVATDHGDVRVYQSSGLEEAFTHVEVGDSVRIEYLGLIQTKKGRAFRQFRAEVYGDAEATKKAKTRKPRATTEK